MNKKNSTDPLERQVRQTIGKYGLLKYDEPVLAAVSGGCDSLVLMYVLKLLGCRVTVAHFDHQTRCGESGKDAEFVREVAETLELPYMVGTESVEEDAARAGVPFEQYARMRRYRFLEAAARESGAGVIATGHHLDDQAETVLMGILGLASGFGPGGLAPISEVEGIRLVRPLLECNREGLRDWAVRCGLHWRDDATNAERCCMRNHIRLDLLPLLEQYNPGVKKRLVHWAEEYRTDTAYLDAQAAEFLREHLHPSNLNRTIFILNGDAFNRKPKSLKRHILKGLARLLDVRLTSEHEDRVETFMDRGAEGGRLDFGARIMLHRLGGEVHIVPVKLSADAVMEPVPLQVPGVTESGSYIFRTQFMEEKEGVAENIINHVSPMRQFFDWDALEKPLLVRGRRPGDVMEPYGMKHARKVQDIMTENHVPRYWRDAAPLVVSVDKIVWVPGCRRSNIAPLQPNTQRILEISCEYAANIV